MTTMAVVWMLRQTFSDARNMPNPTRGPTQR